jgi:hypothetical protein
MTLRRNMESRWMSSMLGILLWGIIAGGSGQIIGTVLAWSLTSRRIVCALIHIGCIFFEPQELRIILFQNPSASVAQSSCLKLSEPHPYSSMSIFFTGSRCDSGLASRSDHHNQMINSRRAYGLETSIVIELSFVLAASVGDQV